MMIVANRAAVIRAIETLRVVAVTRLGDPGKVRAGVDALAAGGVRALEVTMTVPNATAIIREIAPTLADDFLLGAGTVTSVDAARAVIDAGARFIVSPVFQ